MALLLHQMLVFTANKVEHPPQGWPSSWGWEQREAITRDPYLGPIIPESWPRNTFWTYSDYKLHRHQSFAWCHMQACCQWPRGKLLRFTWPSISATEEGAQKCRASGVQRGESFAYIFQLL
jgi:hypothetical protein